MDFLTPEEIGETARLIEAATGSKRHPYEIGPADARQTDVAPLPENALFRYRTAARRHMVMTEIKR
jgi:pyruvate formate lyase activating enzyme